MDEISTLPEIAMELSLAGFSVEIADDHSQIFVTLTSRILHTREICDVLGWDWDTIPSNIKMTYMGHGVIVRDDCEA
jgi:hypothetical protein